MVSRREFLAGGEGALYGLALLGGCTELRPSANSIALPDARDPTYRNWLPVPSSVGRPSRSVYDVEYTSVADLLSSGTDQRFEEFYLQPVLKTWSFLGLAPGEIDDVTTIEAVDGVRATVVRGDFDRETVAEAVGVAGYDALDYFYRGYDRYHRPSPDRTLGIADGVVVYARGPEPETLLESVVDARHDRSPRYHDVNGDVAVLTDELGERAVVRITLREAGSTSSPGTFVFKGSRACGYSREVEDGVRYTRVVVPFVDEDAADTEAVRESIEGNDAGPETFEVYRDGRTVFVDGKAEIT